MPRAMLRRKWASAWRLFRRGSSGGPGAAQASHSAVAAAAQCLASTVGRGASHAAFRAPRASEFAGLALREAPPWERMGRRAQVRPAPYGLRLL